ncbi:MAG: LytTR family DNA-binding domain-containing protein [Candidatus Azobacteroides sp.]|nr:LytTR family DNA-binding domain-containing protein [Candidatus Azobacteroides sp.]
MEALIIEDEVMAAHVLQSLVEELYNEIRIVGVLQTIEESIEWFRQRKMPDLVFMDIHLADGSSFTIFEETDVTCPVIFTTAYDEYALKAFEVNSIDYLLKPIDKNALGRAISKYENFSGGKNKEDILLVRKFIEEVKINKITYKRHFLLHDKDKLIPIPVNDIAYIYIDTKIVKAVTFEKKSYFLGGTMEEIMLQLDPKIFFRANRQYIISYNAIKDLSIWFGSKLAVNLKISSVEKILISKARVKEFKDWFGG